MSITLDNIGEERNVGSFNYDSIVRGGGKLLEPASQHVVVKSSTDLSEHLSPGEFRKSQNQSADIQEIKTKWKEKMRQLQEKGYKEKELLNYLRFLKEQEIKGPFSCAEDAKRFMDSCDETNEKIHRMYIEVRYAKNSPGIGDNKSMFWMKKDEKLLTSVDY